MHCHALTRITLTLSLVVTLSLGLSSAALSASTPACKVRDPDIGLSYVGPCKNGYANGTGEARGRDTYKGPFEDGEPHGVGRYTWGPGSDWSGDVYVGDWKAGARTGQGSYTGANGVKYEGAFVSGKQEGFGVVTIPRIQVIGTNWEQFGTWHGDVLEVKGLFRDNSFFLACENPQDCWARWEASQAQQRTQQQAQADALAGALEAQQFNSDMEKRRACKAQELNCKSNCASVNDSQRRSTCVSNCNKNIYCY